MRKGPCKTVEIHFRDEAPKIGCGRRRVRILTIGHKWVAIENVSSHKRQKIRRAVFNALMETNANAQIAL